MIKRGQNSKKLERAFIKCFRDCFIGEGRSIVEKYRPVKKSWLNTELHLKRQIKYNEKPGKVHTKPLLLICASASVLKSIESKRYIENEIHNFEKWLGACQEALNYFSRRKGKTSDSAQIKNAIKVHCTQLLGIIKYVQRGSSDNLKQEVLRILIWGNQKLPVAKQYLLTQKERDTLRYWKQPIDDNLNEIKSRREPYSSFIGNFRVETLEEICENTHFLRNCFSGFYQDKNLSVSEAEGSKFIEFVLSTTLYYIKFCDWSTLPNFY